MSNVNGRVDDESKDISRLQEITILQRPRFGVGSYEFGVAFQIHDFRFKNFFGKSKNG